MNHGIVCLWLKLVHPFKVRDNIHIHQMLGFQLLVDRKKLSLAKIQIPAGSKAGAAGKCGLPCLAQIQGLIMSWEGFVLGKVVYSHYLWNFDLLKSVTRAGNELATW